VASTPAFISTYQLGTGQAATNANRDGSSPITTILTGSSGGTRINEIIIQAAGTTASPAAANPADSIVCLFLRDPTGTPTWRLFLEVDLDDPATSSATVAGYRTVLRFDNLVLPDASWSLGATVTVAPTSGAINVIALGGSLTEVVPQTIVNIGSGASYTLAAADVNELLTFAPSAGNTTTVSVHSTLTGLATGARIDVMNIGQGTVTFQSAAAPNAVTLNATPGLSLRAQYSAATLICLNASSSPPTYVLVGDLTA